MAKSGIKAKAQNYAFEFFAFLGAVFLLGAFTLIPALVLVSR